MKIVKINVRGSGVIAPSGTRFKSLLHLNIYIQFSTEKKKKKIEATKVMVVMVYLYFIH